LARNGKARKAANAQRQILLASIGLFALGAALFVASVLVAHAPAAAVMRAAAPRAAFVGALLLLLYLVVRRAAAPRRGKHADSIVFGQSTTMFQQPPAPHEPRE
jgi:hypothetical protein